MASKTHNNGQFLPPPKPSSLIPVQRCENDHVDIDVLSFEHMASLRGLLAPHVRTTVAPEQWHTARELAWCDVVRAGWR